MRVVAWVPQACDTSPGQRFRIEQWAPYLAREGVQVAFSEFADPRLTQLLSQPGAYLAKTRAVVRAWARRVAEAMRGEKADLVYIFREDALLGPAVAARLLAARGIPYVFDFDDAVFVRYVSPANGLLSYLRFPGKTAALCRLARHVMAGNPFLASYAKNHNPRVSVVPTTIDTRQYLPPRRARGSVTVPVLGWSGSFSTVQYLESMRPVLEKLARRRAYVLRVIGAVGPPVSGVEVDSRSWSPQTETADISTFDVGIMPLPDDPWARGKCGLKALQYMALGVPPVVSPVGVNTEIVDHGRNGLVAASEDEWVDSLDRLLGDAELRSRLSSEARETVERRYSAENVAPRVAELFRSALA
jgi:glycosyltransferase involved in cell wall biosynthesis